MQVHYPWPLFSGGGEERLQQQASLPPCSHNAASEVSSTVAKMLSPNALRMVMGCMVMGCMVWPPSPQDMLRGA